jgi:hypothetical protein
MSAPGVSSMLPQPHPHPLDSGSLPPASMTLDTVAGPDGWLGVNEARDQILATVARVAPSCRLVLAAELARRLQSIGKGITISLLAPCAGDAACAGGIIGGYCVFGLLITRRVVASLLRCGRC